MLYGKIQPDGSVLATDDPCSMMDWAIQDPTVNYRSGGRGVARNTVGDYLVSTVFLPTDHGFGGEPMWFETMVFRGGWEDLYCRRYATVSEADDGLANRVRQLLAGFKPDEITDDDSDDPIPVVVYPSEGN